MFVLTVFALFCILLLFSQIYYSFFQILCFYIFQQFFSQFLFFKFFVWEYEHQCPKAPRLHDDFTTRGTRPNHATTGLALWSSLTLETRSHPWVRAGHPQYMGAWFARKAVDGPIPPQRLTNALRTLTW